MDSALKFQQLMREFFIFYALANANGVKLLSKMQSTMFFMNFMNWYKHYSKRSFGNIDSKVSFVMMFLSTFQSYSIYPKLIANSANCVFTFMDAVMGSGTGTESYFIKLVPLGDKGVDNPVVDNVNAKLLSTITKGTPAEPHIMQFVESFLSYLPTLTTWDVPNDDNMENWPFSLEASRNYVNASVMVALNGNAVKEARDSNMTSIIFAFSEFFMNVIVELGAKYGVVHNDLHLGNLFYVPSSRTIVMIDYGRMYIGAPPSIPGFTDFIHYELFKNAYLPESTSDYASFMQAFGNAAGVKNEGGDPRMCISDAITVCANMYLLSRVMAPHFEDIFQDMVTFKSVETIGFSTNNTATLLQIYCGIVNSYANHTMPEVFKYISIIGEGLLLLVLLVISRMPEAPTSYLHRCFQFKYNREEFEKFLDFLDNELYNVRRVDPEFYKYFLERTSLLSRLYMRKTVSGGNIAMRSRLAATRSVASRRRSLALRVTSASLHPIPHTKPLFDPVASWGYDENKVPSSKLRSLKSFAHKNYDSRGKNMSLLTHPGSLPRQSPSRTSSRTMETDNKK